MNQESDEIYQNRLWNLRQIVKAAGGTNALAKITGRKNSQISDLAGPNPQRNIGSKLSASLETELGLAPGSLDIPPPKEAKVSDPYLSQIVATLAHTSDDDKQFVLAMANWIAARSTARSAGKSAQGKINLGEVVDNDLDVPGFAPIIKPVQRKRSNL